LICAKNKHIPPRTAKSIYDTYYQVHNLDEMLNVLHLVVEQRKDPMREERLKAVRASGLASHNASQCIIDYLRKTFSKADA